MYKYMLWLTGRIWVLLCNEHIYFISLSLMLSASIKEGDLMAIHFIGFWFSIEKLESVGVIRIYLDFKF